jgi:hypothetical protein
VPRYHGTSGEKADAGSRQPGFFQGVPAQVTDEAGPRVPQKHTKGPARRDAETAAGTKQAFFAVGPVFPELSGAFEES